MSSHKLLFDFFLGFTRADSEPDRHRSVTYYDRFQQRTVNCMSCSSPEKKETKQANKTSWVINNNQK